MLAQNSEKIFANVVMNPSKYIRLKQKLLLLVVKVPVLKDSLPNHYTFFFSVQPQLLFFHSELEDTLFSEGAWQADGRLSRHHRQLRAGYGSLAGKWLKGSAIKGDRINTWPLPFKEIYYPLISLLSFASFQDKTG